MGRVGLHACHASGTGGSVLWAVGACTQPSVAGSGGVGLAAVDLRSGCSHVLDSATTTLAGPYPRGRVGMVMAGCDWGTQLAGVSAVVRAFSAGAWPGGRPGPAHALDRQSRRPCHQVLGSITRLAGGGGPVAHVLAVGKLGLPPRVTNFSTRSTTQRRLSPATAGMPGRRGVVSSRKRLRLAQSARWHPGSPTDPGIGPTRGPFCPRALGVGAHSRLASNAHAGCKSLVNTGGQNTCLELACF